MAVPLRGGGIALAIKKKNIFWDVFFLFVEKNPASIQLKGGGGQGPVDLDGFLTLPFYNKSVLNLLPGFPFAII